MSLQDQLLSEQGKLAQLADEMDAISNAAGAEDRELSADELKLLESYPDKIEKSKARIKTLQSSVDALGRAAERRALAVMPAPREQPGHSRQASIPTIRQYSPKSRYFANALDAYNCGMWLSATLGRNNRAIQYCREHNVGGWSNAMEEGTDTAGGFTVPDPLAATIIELIEQFGVFRANARNVPMTSDTLRVPKLPEVPTTDRKPDSSLSVYYPDEGAAITPSDLTFEQVSMAAVKYAQLAIWSTELNEDAVISMTDLLARDVARNFAWAEDRNSFLGDGTATYGGITGVMTALQAGATVTASGAAAANITLGDLNKLLAVLKEYPGLEPKYYMSKSMYWNVVVPLLQAAGGTNMPQIESGPMTRLNGYPVVITQVLPGSDATTGTDVIICGDLDLGAYCATRRQVQIRILTELYAASDQLGIVATMRGDSVTHSVGDATDCGCIAKLALA
jgi:HK97 family phage major capsid protein